MGKRTNLLVLSFLAAASTVLVAAGCRTTPRPATEVKRKAEPEAPPRVRGEVPPHRRPSLEGDVLVYPVQWRNAEELGYRLYHILYPKYGPALQIVPDPVNNVLLVYLPPGARGR